LNRLITTFDEVPPLLTEANLLSAIHIADNDGVTFETCTAEVFRPVPTWKPKLSNSRPARTPPSTFLFLHLYLSNSPEPKAPATRGRAAKLTVSTF